MRSTSNKRIACCALGLAAALLSTGEARAHVAFLAPEDGEFLEIGTVFTVKWRVIIAHDDWVDWDLWYSTTGDKGPWISIAKDLPFGDPTIGSEHSYEWTIPNDPSAQARVRVRMDNVFEDFEAISFADLIIGTAPTIPAVSPWGLVCMVLLLLVATSVVLQHRAARTSFAH